MAAMRAITSGRAVAVAAVAAVARVLAAETAEG